MWSLNRAIRAKRYKVKEPVFLSIQLQDGTSAKLKVLDCSSTGIRCVFENDFKELDENVLLPNAKIETDQFEYPLGSILVRRADKETQELAISTVQTRVPIEGHLSKYLELDLETNGPSTQYELDSGKFNLAHFVENEYTNVDLFDRTQLFSIYLNDWRNSQKYAYYNIRKESKGTRVQLEKSRRGNRNDYIMMGSNDYHGLSSHPEVIQAAQSALQNYGFGSTGSPVTTGLTDIHHELCTKLAKMHNRESALLFNSGYAANLGIIGSITSANDLIIADQLSHVSIQDAMTYSKATSRFFKHNDINHLEKILKRERKDYNGCLIISEGVFSMDGDVPPLDQIYNLARKYQARIMVDQAHCFGVVGPNGLGAAEKYNLLRKADIIMGTFSKVCGGIGGFCVGDSELIDWFMHNSRPYIFSVSLPPSTCAAVLKALEIFEEDKSLLKNLKRNINHFKNNLSAIGYHIEDNHESAVIPVVIGNEEKLGIMYQELMSQGVFVIPIVYPAVSRKECRFRFTIMSTHTISDLDYVTSCFENAMYKADFHFEERKKKTFKRKTAVEEAS